MTNFQAIVVEQLRQLGKSFGTERTPAVISHGTATRLFCSSQKENSSWNSTVNTTSRRQMTPNMNASPCSSDSFDCVSKGMLRELREGKRVPDTPTDTLSPPRSVVTARARGGGWGGVEQAAVRLKERR